MSIHDTALEHYDTFKDDYDAQAKIRLELKTLSLELLTDANKSYELTSSTVNGQSMSGTRTMTNEDRRKILKRVVQMFDLGGPVSSRTNPYF